MMGFSSCFLRFFPLVPLAALVADCATCLAFWIAAFLMSDPFIFTIGKNKIQRWLTDLATVLSVHS